MLKYHNEVRYSGVCKDIFGVIGFINLLFDVTMKNIFLMKEIDIFLLLNTSSDEKFVIFITSF